MVVDHCGYPLDWCLTPGQASDIGQAEALLEDKSAFNILADKAYDADKLLEMIKQQGAQAVIPPRANRIIQREYDRQLYKERNQVERYFNKIKHFRRIATRYDKTDCCYLALLALAAICICLS